MLKQCREPTFTRVNERALPTVGVTGKGVNSGLTVVRCQA